MIRTIAVEGYRSLRDLKLPLGQLNVITGANGSGKSSAGLTKEEPEIAQPGAAVPHV